MKINCLGNSEFNLQSYQVNLIICIKRSKTTAVPHFRQAHSGICGVATGTGGGDGLIKVIKSFLENRLA